MVSDEAAFNQYVWKQKVWGMPNWKSDDKLESIWISVKSKTTALQTA
jgi:hypothetical protein